MKLRTMFATGALAAALCSWNSYAFAAMPEAGQEAPTFTLPSQDGTTVSLSDFKGKWVVLYFYPKDFLIDPQGKIVKVWTGVDPQHHSEEVLAELSSDAKK